MAHTVTLICCWATFVSTPALAAGASIFPSLRRHEAAKQEATAPAAKPEAEHSPMPPAPPAVVPAPVNTGNSGFPELPAVSSMLTPAEETLKAINEQAAALEAKTLQAQMADSQRMAKQKAVFEQRLRQQEQANLVVVAENKEVEKEIATLKKDNEGLRKHSRELQESNALARKELKSLQKSLALVTEFAKDSLVKTDDAKAKELVVLQQSKGKGRRAHRHILAQMESMDTEEPADSDDLAAHSDDEQDDDQDQETAQEDEDTNGDDEEDVAASLLQLDSSDNQISALETVAANAMGTDLGSPTEPPADPTGILKTLASGVANLAAQEKQSETKLKKMFVTDFQAGNRRHAALMQQQRSLNATRAGLENLQDRLDNAVTHLEHTQNHLQQDLRGFGLFAQRLAHLALAPAKEVPRLMEALPAKVEPAALPTPAPKA
eukprot:gnl/TRDRNA2_/TRDRNA2_133860_c0_seq2.p1 gnl/TRDRNA2_/TRDRNA2_133860_c0~~gnl/TRDRNA2_/TRDRNA2_133860_c0_seq2.p1  ORF type:complete len:436 (+),score=134.20 gnl/TRDRNA2_/TRDRNA2_133860_c0_seq2:53-1360(+)